MGKNKVKKKNQLLLIISASIAAIIVLIVCIVLATNRIKTMNEVSNNENNSIKNESDSYVTDDEIVNFEAEDVQELENTYLTLFIAYMDDNSELLNSFASILGLKSESNIAYSTYSDDTTAIIYSRKDIDTALSETFGTDEIKEKPSINGLYDSTNDIYVTHNDYDATGYRITSSTYNLENNTIVFDVEYYSFTNEDYNTFEAEYISKHDTSKYAMGDGVDPKLYDDIKKSYEDSKEKSKVQIKITKNNQYTFSKYRLLNIEKK